MGIKYADVSLKCLGKLTYADILFGFDMQKNCEKYILSQKKFDADYTLIQSLEHIASISI
jgi:hypothetical protein